MNKTVEPETETERIEEILDSVKDKFDDIETNLTRVGETVEDATATLRMEMAQSRREMIEMKAYISRLQNRVDSQMTVLVLANIASGIGVAALMLGITRI